MSNKNSYFNNQSAPATDNKQHNGDDCPPLDTVGTIPQTLNDNSNPQQGTNLMHPTVGNLASNDSTKAPAQQQPRTTLLIPPTVKDARKLFVGGLPSDVTCDEFRAFFEVYGAVLDSVVMYDHVTSNSRGFGFVTFEDEAVSSKLLEMGRLEMRGKLVEVKPAQPKGKALPPSTSVSNHSAAAHRKPHGGPRRLDSSHSRSGSVEAGSMAQVNFDNLSLMAMAPSSPTAIKLLPDTSCDDASVVTPAAMAVALPAPYAPPVQEPFVYETYPVVPALSYGASTGSSLTGASPTASGSVAVAAPVVPLVGTYYAPPSPGSTMPFQPYGSYYGPSPNPYYHMQYHPHVGHGNDMHGCYGPVFYADSVHHHLTTAYSSLPENQGASPPFPRKTE